MFSFNFKLMLPLHSDQESKSTPRLTLQDAVMDAAGDEIETHFHKHRRPSAAASVLVFADADEWFDRQLASLRLGKEGRTGADITAQPTLISDKEMVAALTELMRVRSYTFLLCCVFA